MKKVLRLTESELVSLIGKIIEEQGEQNSNTGWDKLKKGQSIKLKDDRDGSITSWVVHNTSPNPGKDGKGNSLSLYPNDDAARALTSEIVDATFFPNEMKIKFGWGMNTIVKDTPNQQKINKPSPTPAPLKSDPNKPRLFKQDMTKKGFYPLYNSGKMWETGSNAYSGFHIKKDLSYGETKKGPIKICLIGGKTPDGLIIQLEYDCQKKKLYIVSVGTQRMFYEVENLDVLDGCNCPQG